jgi:NADP-dependent 3-hydroxy acid dehydrogenase YdfG
MSQSSSPKVVVVTGASAGIGATLAAQLAAAGHTLVLAARREAELTAIAAPLGALPVVTDVTDRAQVEALCARALEVHGRIDVWVNNAGRGITRPVSTLTDADLDDMMSVNVKSALYGMQAVLPHFKARNAGQIINVSSVLGRVPFAPLRSAYSASKHFLNALTANLRMELAATHPGITVSLFTPGVVSTDFGLNALHGGPDNRMLPGAQDVTEVAGLIAGMIESRRTDVYSRPGYKDQVVAYFSADDMGAFEQQFQRR